MDDDLDQADGVSFLLAHLRRDEELIEHLLAMHRVRDLFALCVGLLVHLLDEAGVDEATLERSLADWQQQRRAKLGLPLAAGARSVAGRFLQLLAGMAGLDLTPVGAAVRLSPRGNPAMPEHEIDLHGRQPGELRQIAADLDAELISLHADENGELRELDRADQDRFDRLTRQREAIAARLRQHEAIGEAWRSGRGVERLGEPAERHGWVTAPGTDPSLARFRTEAMRTLERYQGNDVLSARAADTVDEVIRRGDPQGITARYTAAVGNEAYLTAFGKMLADPVMAHLRFSPEEVEAVREVGYAGAAAEMRAALTTGTTGFPLPLTVDATFIMSGTGALNPIRDISNVTTIGTHNWVGVSSDGVTAGYVQEGVEATDASPTIAGPNISTQQGRAFCQFTIESGQDWPSLMSELERLVADARNVADATAWLTGTGSNAPFGIFGGDATYSLTTTQRVLTATTAAFAVGDPWSLKGQMPARFVNDATFAAAPSTWDAVYRFVAQGSTTEPRQFADGDRGGDFLGRPKVEWSTMAAGTAGSATGTKVMIAGNWKVGYKIVDRLGMSAELIPHMLGTNRLPLGTRGLYCYWRSGAAVVARNAFRYLEVK